jgi:hypothetical protein
MVIESGPFTHDLIFEIVVVGELEILYNIGNIIF